MKNTDRYSDLTDKEKLELGQYINQLPIDRKDNYYKEKHKLRMKILPWFVLSIPLILAPLAYGVVHLILSR